jgi:hypothetical protein
VVLDEQFNPTVSFSAAFPALSLTTYPGGAAALLRDHRDIMVKSSGVPSRDYVQTAFTGSTQAALANSTSGSASAGATSRHRRQLLQVAAAVEVATTVSFWALCAIMLGCASASVAAGCHTHCHPYLPYLQVWYPATWQAMAGLFPNQTALDALVFNLLYLPMLALQAPLSFPAFNASGVKVRPCFQSSPPMPRTGKLPSFIHQILTPETAWMRYSCSHAPPIARASDAADAGGHHKLFGQHSQLASLPGLPAGSLGRYSGRRHTGRAHHPAGGPDLGHRLHAAHRHH